MESWHQRIVLLSVLEKGELFVILNGLFFLTFLKKFPTKFQNHKNCIKGSKVFKTVERKLVIVFKT